MARHLFIAGIDRWRDYERNTMQIEATLTYQIDTCRFQVRGQPPAEGEEIIIEDDNLGRLFAGIIVKAELARVQPDKSNRLWQVDCDDYTALLDRRLVVEIYENTPADEIFRDIAVKYCSGFTTTGVQSDAPAVEYLVFNYVRPSECFKELCEYIGWHWQPTYYKDLQFFSAEDLVSLAPMKLIPGGKFRFGKHSIDTQGIRNRVYVCGGKMLSDPQPLSWLADGVARTWALPWGPHEVALRVGGVPKTVGVTNLHEEGNFDFIMSFSEKYLRCSSHTATPAAGVTIELTAKQDIDVITLVEDKKSQQAIAAVQGGDGVYEHAIADDNLITIDAAEAAGMADLREHANPRVKGSFETEVNGWRPGQIVSIDLPDRGVVGEYLIQQVTITPATPVLWAYRVEYGGRLLGIADFLKALVSAQQKKVITPALMNKFSYFEEAFLLQDLMFYTTATRPYICGTASAKCGFVVCGS